MNSAYPVDKFMENVTQGKEEAEVREEFEFEQLDEIGQALHTDIRVPNVKALAKIAEVLRNRASNLQHKGGDKAKPIILSKKAFALSQIELWLMDHTDLDLTSEEIDHEFEDKLKVYQLPHYASIGDIHTVMTIEKLSSFMDAVYLLGVDTKNCNPMSRTDIHRDLSGAQVECLRVIGNERFDTEWINSGHASIQAEVYAKGDPTLMRELEEINGGKL